jgi:hypothetical protein
MKKKECPNPIIISSNMGIGNLVKETLPSAPYINPPFAFPGPKEKRKCISSSARTRPTSVQTGKIKIKLKKLKKFHLRADGTNVHEDTLTRPRGQKNKNKNKNKNKFFCIRVDQSCHADDNKRTDGRTDDGRKGVRDLDTL